MTATDTPMVRYTRTIFPSYATSKKWLYIGKREIGFMYGQYKRLTGLYEGVLTGNGYNTALFEWIFMDGKDS